MSDVLTAVAGFSFSVQSQTQSGAIDKMNEISMLFLDHVGGQPWVATDDDVTKHQSNNPIKDDQGMCYIGKRTYSFNGPVIGSFEGQFTPGFELQKGVGNE